MSTKEKILDALIDSAEARYEEMFESEKNIGKVPKTQEEFIKVTMKRISEATTRYQLDGIQRRLVRFWQRRSRLTYSWNITCDY